MIRALTTAEMVARAVCTLAALALTALPSLAAGLPEIRSSPANPVPSCVTPERLMAFVAERNDHLAPKFGAIASNYRDLGQAYQVRWDYAFFQMILETNYLKFQRGDGSSGDVALSQNNFAGVGATGGGVPGDRFPDVRTGVLAHVQHLVAYSGESVERPVAQRTHDHQGDIIEISHRLGRPVTFTDLSRRWASDWAYAKNIETVAELYRKTRCNTVAAVAVALPQAPVRPLKGMAQPSRLGAPLPTDGTLPPVPVEVTRKREPLVRTIWKRGEPQPLVRSQVPRPVQVHRPAPASVTSGSPSGLLSGSDEARDTTQGIARFAAAAQAALASGAVAAPRPCRVERSDDEAGNAAAAVLLRSQAGDGTRLTALPIGSGTAPTQGTGNIVPGAQDGGSFEAREAAVAAARKLCP